jgi:transposase
MDMPAKYDSYKTAWDRFKRWSVKGVWSRILEALMAKGYRIGKLSLEKVAVDNTSHFKQFLLCWDELVKMVGNKDATRRAECAMSMNATRSFVLIFFSRRKNLRLRVF